MTAPSVSPTPSPRSEATVHRTALSGPKTSAKAKRERERAEDPQGTGTAVSADAFERARRRARSQSKGSVGETDSSRRAKDDASDVAFVVSPSIDDITRTMSAMRHNVRGLPASVRNALEREVFTPVSRIVEMLSEDEPSTDDMGAPGVLVSNQDRRQHESDRDLSFAETSILVAGGRETEGVEGLDGDLIDGALYTSRGPTFEREGIEYKAYNEDAAVLGEIPRRGSARCVAFAGVADQAGGMGLLSTPDGEPWTGGASAIAVASLSAAAEEVHRGADPESALRAAIRASHDEVSANNPRAGTTLAGALVLGSEAHVITLGDSEIWHFGPNGELKNRCETDSVEDRLVQSSLVALREEMEADGVELSPDEQRRMQIAAVNAGLTVAHILDACIGGTTCAEPHYTRWAVEPGDYIVFATDGLGDANLQSQKKAVVAGHPWTEHHSEVTASNLSEMVCASTGAEDLAEQLSDYALRQMTIPDVGAYRDAVAEYCEAEEVLGRLHESGKTGQSETRRWQRAMARAQAHFCDAGAKLELAGGDGKPDNIAVVAIRIR